VQATVGILTGRYRASKREAQAQAQMQELHGVGMSLGQVSAIERGVSEALKKPVREARQYAQKQAWAGADETSWLAARQKGGSAKSLAVGDGHGLAWVTVFLRIELKRSGRAARRLLGKFSGTLGTDRWKEGVRVSPSGQAADWLEPPGQGFRGDAGAERLPSHRRGAAGGGGKDVRVVVSGARRNPTLAAEQLRDLQGRGPGEGQAVLKEGTRCRDRITRGKCREILGVFPALWTFVRVPGIEPTNNACERALRAAVLWRKGCFGTRSAAGSRFAERMLTVAATLQQQGRGLLDFLTLAVELHQSGERPPSLLPDDYTFRRLQATA
jgi:transposase